LSELKVREDNSAERILNLQRKKELVESFAFLAVITDDPKRVVIACVEEGEEKGYLIIRLAVNNGILNYVKVGFKRIVKIFERVARTGELYIYYYYFRL